MVSCFMKLGNEYLAYLFNTFSHIAIASVVQYVSDQIFVTVITSKWNSRLLYLTLEYKIISCNLV